MKKILFIAIASALSLTMNAQALFNVMASSNVTEGANTVKSGDALSSGQSLTVKSGGYLALIHVSGKALEVREAGTYKADDLAKKLTTSESSFTMKYADFVGNKLAANEGDGHNYDVTGSVHRAIEGEVSFVSPARIQMVKDISASLTWNAVKGYKNYTILVTTLHEEEVYVKEVSDTMIVLDLSKTELKENETYLVQVSTKDGSIKSDPTKVMLTIKSSQDSEAIRGMVSKLSSELKDDSPIDNMLLASYYDSKGLKLNAENSLRKAKQLAPGVKDFERNYNKYLTSNGGF